MHPTAPYPATDAERATMARAVELARAGVPYDTAARVLLGEGYRTRKGTPISAMQVSRWARAAGAGQIQTTPEKSGPRRPTGTLP